MPDESSKKYFFVKIYIRNFHLELSKLLHSGMRIWKSPQRRSDSCKKYILHWNCDSKSQWYFSPIYFSNLFCQYYFKRELEYEQQDLIIHAVQMPKLFGTRRKMLEKSEPLLEFIQETKSGTYICFSDVFIILLFKS